MATKLDLDPGMEHELNKLSFKEAPKIISEIPGPKSREILATEMENETPTRVTPVSYTHLDVYKRQGLSFS